MARAATLRSVRWWGAIAARALRRVFLAALALLGMATLAGFIFWDVDFYPVRDRWEIFKLAMFGEWPREGAFQLPEDQMFVCEWQEGKTLGTCALTPIDPETQKEMSDAN
jgi:hypothetical protein